MSEKKSGAATRGTTDDTRLHPGDEGLDLLEDIRDQLVVNPPAILSVADDSRLLENAKMERQAGLRGIECVGQLADASLSFAEQLDDLESGLVGKGMKELDRALGRVVSQHSHGFNISRNIVVSIGS
jgi:hypothetical protein